jgi:hypothetical protein
MDDRRSFMLRDAPSKIDIADYRSVAGLAARTSMHSIREPGSAPPFDNGRSSSDAQDGSIHAPAPAAPNEIAHAERHTKIPERNPRLKRSEGGDGPGNRLFGQHPFALVIGLILLVTGFLCLAGMTLGGLSASPSFEIVGAFFPAWMVCALIGIVGGISVRAIFVATGLANALPHQLAVCTAIAVITGILAWLIGFGW